MWFRPRLPLYLSFFYPRHEVGLRIGIFLAGSAAANAYGGVLAYGLSHITSGIAPWRLLFILEGVPTCLMAIVLFFRMPDSPGKAKFLNEEEKEVATARALRQPHAHQKGLVTKYLFAAFKDYKSIPPPPKTPKEGVKLMVDYMTAFMYFGCNVTFASLPVFLPTIISEMGAFTTVQSNGLTAPPYVFCFLVIIATAFISDKTHNRGYFVAGNAFVAAIGFVIMATVTTTGVRYFAIFLCVLIFVSVAMILAWVTNNSGTDSRRAGGLWILTTIGQCGPLLGTSMFPSDEAPYYRKGMWVCCCNVYVPYRACPRDCL
jgi:MFS family permease